MAHITPVDFSVLQAVKAGEPPAVSSSHRVRLELLGLLTEGPEGLRLTTRGVQTLMQKPPVFEPERFDMRAQQYDARGRRKLRKKSGGALSLF